MLKNIIKKTKNLFGITKCNVCDKYFYRNQRGTFRSDPQKGALIYFCPKCNRELTCSCCIEELGRKGFELYNRIREDGHRNVIIICENCIKAGVKVPVCKPYTE